MGMRIALELLLPYFQFFEHGGQQALAYLGSLDGSCLATEVQAAMAALSRGPLESELQTGVPSVPPDTPDELRSAHILRYHASVKIQLF